MAVLARVIRDAAVWGSPGVRAVFNGPSPMHTHTRRPLGDLLLIYPMFTPWGEYWLRPYVTLAVCKESRLYPTRLETRTKESNMYASQWVY